VARWKYFSNQQPLGSVSAISSQCSVVNGIRRVLPLYWLLVVGCWLLAVGYWSLAAEHWSLAAEH
jgi:hypothetical protein